MSNEFHLAIIHKGKSNKVKLSQGISIAIEQTFSDQQPNHFGTPDASRRPYSGDGFVGDTGQGGSCNVDVLQLIPHCNGTHTETIGHIVKGDFYIGRCLMSGPVLAQVITVTTGVGAHNSDTYDPPLEAADRVITKAELVGVLQQIDDLHRLGQTRALIVRTQPNEASKRQREYTFGNPPPYFTTEAMQVICDLGIQHLLVDLPSVDRMQDQGRLSNHCLYWNLNVDTRAITNEAKLEHTITEMVYVPDQVPDGLYLLDLQLAAFNTDASPSRPILFPLEVMN